MGNVFKNTVKNVICLKPTVTQIEVKIFLHNNVNPYL